MRSNARLGPRDEGLHHASANRRRGRTMLALRRFRGRGPFLCAEDQEDAERVGAFREYFRRAILQDCEDLEPHLLQSMMSFRGIGTTYAGRFACDRTEEGRPRMPHSQLVRPYRSFRARRTTQAHPRPKSYRKRDVGRSWSRMAMGRLNPGLDFYRDRCSSSNT